MDPRGTWKPDYSRRWEMNWPELSCLSHHCCFCWAHTGSWVASFLGSGSLCHQSPHWKLSPAGRGQLSAIPTLFCPAGWMFGVPELHAGTYWSGVGSDTLFPRPAGPGELHTGRSDGFMPVPGSAGFTGAAARTLDTKPGLRTGRFT